jgi:pimeloyl-ACP methyl ester carboxylesterase
VLATNQSYAHRYFTSANGLQLHVRDYGSKDDPGIPVLCLAGLSRNSADFHVLAEALAEGAAGKKRRVAAPDYRGRGLSDYDPDWKNYDIAVEAADIQGAIEALALDRAIVIGTSRGGLHAMLLGVARPDFVRGIVLNDVGPVIETAGLSRISRTIGQGPVPASWPEAVELVKRVNSSHFPSLSEADWEAFARLSFVEEDGRIFAPYDANLLKTLEGFDPATPLPDLWHPFESLRDIPLMVIRGELSDLLSRETVAEMTRRHPNCHTLEIPSQGHAPLLIAGATIAAIAEFIASVDP